MTYVDVIDEKDEIQSKFQPKNIVFEPFTHHQPIAINSINTQKLETSLVLSSLIRMSQF